jgi:hypothetical protein
LEILRDNGFEVTTVDEAMALSQRLYDASLAAGTIDQYDEKFITMMLEEECMTEEEAASIRASKAAAAQGTQPVVTGEEGMNPTEDVELPPEVPPTEATEMPLTTEEEPAATTTPEEVVLPPEVPPTQ